MFSTTYIAEYVKILAVLSTIFGYQINEEELTVIVGFVVFTASSLWTFYQRYKRGDVHILGKRK